MTNDKKKNSKTALIQNGSRYTVADNVKNLLIRITFEVVRVRFLLVLCSFIQNINSLNFVHQFNKTKRINGYKIEC